MPQDYLVNSFRSYETMCKNLLEDNLIIPAYELCIKASHCFNLMESRG